MRCKKARILISAAIDGELSRREELALERHMSACAECARESARLSTLSDAMSLWADEEPSEWLAESFAYKLREFMDKGRAGSPAPAYPRRRILGAAAAGIAAALLILGLLLHGQFQTPVPQDTSGPPAVIGLGEPEEASLPDTAGESEERAPAVIETVPDNPAEAKPAPPVRTRPSAAPVIRRDPVHVAAEPAMPAHQPVAPAPSDAGRLPEMEHVAAQKIVVAGVVQGTAAVKVSDNLGEAGLAMNETIERVRGSLQKAVDLIVSEYPMPASDSMDFNGGNIL